MVKTMAIIFLEAFILTSCAFRTECDIIIQDAIIFSGNGEKPFRGNIAISQNLIVKVGKFSNFNSSRIIDAKGYAVSPGFIDLHAHIEPLPIIPEAESAIRMGVTTVLGGPDGSSPLRMDRYLDSLERIGVNLNVAYLIGHNSVRLQVMGLDNSKPTKVQLDSMKILVRNAMNAGAFGISTGLKYVPGTFAETPELIELSKVVAEMGGIYTTHLRDEGSGWIESTKEAIEIARKANIPVVLSHYKALGHQVWGSSEVALGLVNSARNEGLDIMMDQYPYTASSTSLNVLLPSWTAGIDMKQRKEIESKNGLLKDSITNGIRDIIVRERGGGDLTRIQFSRVQWQTQLEGKTLHDWAVIRSLEPNSQTGASLIFEAWVNGGASAIYHLMSEDDVVRIMQHPMTMIASDGRLTKPGSGFPHPRSYGTFPRVLGLYARDKKILTMEEAIKKMTSMPAERLGLKRRGRLKPGYLADLVIFDPEAIIDKASFTDPHLYPEGIHYVLVNGQIVLDRGELQESRPGMILRGPAFDPTNQN